MKNSLIASTLVEVLVAMMLSGVLLLSVYDGLEMLDRGIEEYDDADDDARLDWLEHYELLEFRSDSVKTIGQMNLFYQNGEPCDTLMNYGF